MLNGRLLFYSGYDRAMKSATTVFLAPQEEEILATLPPKSVLSVLTFHGDIIYGLLESVGEGWLKLQDLKSLPLSEIQELAVLPKLPKWPSSPYPGGSKVFYSTPTYSLYSEDPTFLWLVGLAEIPFWQRLFRKNLR